MRKNSNIIPKTWNQINSYNYELYCIDYHQNLTNDETWHWKNIPESILFDSGFVTDFNKLRLRRKDFFEENNKYYNIVREYGLDGLSFDGNAYHGIQSKLYNIKSYLTASDVGTFLSVIYNRMMKKNPLSSGYLYYTGRLQLDLRDDIDNSKGQIVRTLLPYDENIQNDFFQKNPHLYNQNKESENESELKESEYILRPYQKKAIDTLNQEWEGTKLLHLPCGTGKTVIFCNHVKEKTYKNIFIISPLKVHVKQNLERMKEFLPNYETLLLDSDVEGSTDFEVLEENLNKNSIISTTFDSAQNILKKLFYEKDDLEEDDYNEDNLEDDLEDDCEEDDEESVISYYESKYDLENTILIVDEAHNLINKDELIKIVKSFPKVLLVTATPPSTMEEVMSCDLIYQYPFRKAIEEKYICDYQIYLPLLTIDEHSGISKVDIEKPIELKDLDTDLTQKSLYLINGMLQSGSRKCIAYLSSQEECIQFTKVFEEVMKKYHYLPFWIKSIICDVSDNERKNILEEFQNDDKENSLKIICSIRILNEGIDIPKCDSIFIGNIGEYSSDITMVQRMCRANRLVKERPNKVANCFLWTNDLNKIVDSLSLLKDNDIEFHKKIKVINGNYDKQSEKSLIDKIEKENKLLNEFIQVKCMSYEDIWEMKKNLLFEFCNINKRIIKTDEKYKTYNIGMWYNDQKKKIKNIDNNLYQILSVNEYVKISLNEYLKIINKWEIKKNLVFQFCEQYKRIPKQDEKYYDINIGNWYNISQKRKIKSTEDILYKKLSINNIVKDSIDDYLKNKEANKNKIKLTFDEFEHLLFEFCNKYERVPTSTENYNNFNIGSCFYNKKENIKSTSDELYKKWSVNKYIKKSFDDYLIKKEKNKNKEKVTSEEWETLLYNFCSTYQKVPTQREIYQNKPLGKWFQHKKEKILSIDSNDYKKFSINPIIKKSIDDFLATKEENKNKQKLSYEEWKLLLFEFCDINNRVPQNKESYKGFNIGSWFHYTQKSKKIDSINNEFYKKLSIKPIIKDCLDKYLENKNNLI